MKKSMIALTVMLFICIMLSGCFSENAEIRPLYDEAGEPKTFEHDGIKLLLSDRFTEKQSSLGFDAYYVSDFCGVVVLKEAFTLEEGLADLSLEEYIRNVITNNAHTGIDPQNRDGLWFYVKDTGESRVYSYSFKGADAFWIVQYICRCSDANMLEGQIEYWAKNVEIK